MLVNPPAGWLGGKDGISPEIRGLRSNFLLVPPEVDGAIASCSEMHDMKEAIYEYKKKLEGIGEDYQIQVIRGLLGCELSAPGNLWSCFCTGMRRM